jgi:hypothetical protein
MVEAGLATEDDLGWRELEIAVGAVGVALVGSSTHRDQGGAPVSGWRRRPLLELRLSGGGGMVWDERGPGQTLSLIGLLCSAFPCFSVVGRSLPRMGRPCSATVRLTSGLVWCGFGCGRCCRVLGAGTSVGRGQCSGGLCLDI